MATRSMIAIEYGDKVYSAYVHFDGYLAGVGESVKETPYDELYEIIKKGSSSSFNAGFYDESDSDITYDSVSEYFHATNKRHDVEYLYLKTKDGDTLYRSCRYGKWGPIKSLVYNKEYISF